MPIVQWPGVAALIDSASGLVAKVVASTTDAKVAALMTYAEGPMQELTFK